MKARVEKKKNCQSCNTKFGLTTHKHSCKRCHGIICSECTKQKMQIIQYSDKKPHKICLNCSDDHQHNTNLKVTGKLQWGVDSNIMKQWLKNINTIDKDKLEKQYQDILISESPLTQQQEFSEYQMNIEQQISHGNSMKHFNLSFLEMVHSVWGSEPDIQKIRQQIINVLKVFFADFPDQESPLAFKQEYVDLAIFLLQFGQESSAWRMMKEIYGIIIPIESISHITNNDFNYGEKYLMNFLLDKINYDFSSKECGNIYKFIQDRGIEIINSFFTNLTNFQTSYQIFNHVINMPYNRRWSELLRCLGVYIIENKDLIGQNYEKIVWDDMKLELNINTKWKRVKEKMDVYCYFHIADQRQMSRFSMVEDITQQEMDQLQPSPEDIIEENKMLKKEVFQIFKVKQLITQKMDELDDMRMELQKRELIRQKYEENLKKFNEMQSQYDIVQSQNKELQYINHNLQEKLVRFSQNYDSQSISMFDDQKRTTSLVYPLPGKDLLLFSSQNNKQQLQDDQFLQEILKDKEKIQIQQLQDNKGQQPKDGIGIASDDIQIKKVNSYIEEPNNHNHNHKDQPTHINTHSQLNDNGTQINNNQEGQDKHVLFLTPSLSEHDKVQNLSKEKDDLESKNKMLSSKADQYMNQFKSQGDQILQQKLKIQKREDEIEQLKSESAKLKAEHIAQIATLEKKLEEQKTQHQQIIEQLKDQSKINEIELRHKAESTTQKEKIEQLNLYNQILQQEKTEIFLQKQNLIQQVNSLQLQNNNTSTATSPESNKYSSEINNLRNTITKLELELNSEKENNLQHQKCIQNEKNKEAMISSLEQQLQLLQLEISEIKNQNSLEKCHNHPKSSIDSTTTTALSTQESTNKSPIITSEKNEIKQGNLGHHQSVQLIMPNDANKKRQNQMFIIFFQTILIAFLLYKILMR